MNCADFDLMVYASRLLDLRWIPPIETGECYSKCSNHLERMNLTAFLYRMDEARFSVTGTQLLAWSDSGGSATVDEAWLSFSDQVGPSELKITPQCSLSGCTRDFVFSFDGDPVVIVECDGYAHHRGRRLEDRIRDETAPLPTIRLLEEIEPPLSWPARLLEADWSAPCTHCGIPIKGDHSCPPF